MVQGIFPNEMILDFLGKPKFAGCAQEQRGLLCEVCLCWAACLCSGLLRLAASILFTRVDAKPETRTIFDFIVDRI